jgi:hypothetical protein
MEATSIRATDVRHPTSPQRSVAYVGAVLFVLAAGWATLAKMGIIAASEPANRDDLTVAQNQLRYYRWFVGSLMQERATTILAIAAFGCLATTAIWLARGRRAEAATLFGAVATAGGAFLWVVGGVLLLGGHWAVGLLATHDYTTQMVSAVGFPIDQIQRGFEIAAFASIAVGLIVFAAPALRERERRAYTWFTMVTAGVALATAISVLPGTGDWYDVLVLMGGVAVLPIWLVWTARTAPMP